MLFTTWLFVLFFGVVLGAVYAVGKNNVARKVILVAVSIFFYGMFFPIHVPVLLGQIAVNYLALYWLCGAAGRPRPWILTCIVAANLGVLVFYKYAGFLATNILGQPIANPALAPLGVSFYTFHMISLAVDLRASKRDAIPEILDYSFYVTFWPQLISGPITRGHEILPQLREAPIWSAQGFRNGFLLIALGLFYKSVIADGLAAPIVNLAYLPGWKPSMIEAWAAACAFGVQIYGDFFGYTTCAIGAALCLGYQLPENFRAPYGAAGFSDFWRRWHITLSRWIRDYVYRPLGGNRQGQGRTVANLMMTMGLAGLWHGAGWNYIVWGLAHGLLLAIEHSVPPLRRLRQRVSAYTRGEAARRPPILYVLITFLCVTFVWVSFRAPDMTQTAIHWTAMFTGSGQLIRLTGGDVTIALTLAAIVLLMHVLLPRGEADALLKMRPTTQILVATCMIALYIVVPTEQQPFIYFQF